MATTASQVKRSKKGLPPVGSKKGKTCETRWCRNLKARHHSGYLMSLCWKCQSRRLKKRRPLTYVLNALRNGARKRGIPCTLTLAEFEKFCAETGYLAGRGQKPDSLTIDRIDHEQGYCLTNIQCS